MVLNNQENHRKDCAIYFDDQAYSIDVNNLMGRNSAGSSFLNGYFKHGSPEKFWVYANEVREAKLFANIALSAGSRSQVQFIAKENFRSISLPGTIYYPGPDLENLSWQRHLVADNAWSICGITHTTASAKVMDSIGSYFVAPLKSWDAVICTSQAVKTHLENILSAKKYYMQKNLGVKTFELPQLPVIPLGINSSDFCFSVEQKSAARAKFGADENTIIVLYVGRLSFHAKANPIPMYIAIEEAAKRNKKNKVKIIECGWHYNEKIKASFSEAANEILDKVELVFLDGRKKENRDRAWAAADIFCSFSDNIQETFGISPIEAMATGLPVIVSDWNGYKETVRDSEDGYRIQTIMPEPNSINDFVEKFSVGLDNYDQYIGKTSAFISIDVGQATERFSKLFNSKEERKRLGQNGMRRAQEYFDWKYIIPKYEKLWQSLNEERQKFDSKASANNKWPERLDPYRSFAHYSSKRIVANQTLCIRDHNLNKNLKKVKLLKGLKMSQFIKEFLPEDHEIKNILESLIQNSKTIQEMLESFSQKRRLIIYRGLFWLLKMGIIKTKD